MWLTHEHFDRPFKNFVLLEKMYNLTLGQNCNFSKKHQPWKNHVSFMPHAFNQSGHPFGQCRHLSQVEPFEKPWFVVVVMVKISLIYVCIKHFFQWI